MKKLIFLGLCLIINISIVSATTGSLKNSSITKCDQTYGYHSKDKHYHKAILKKETWYASSKNLGTTNPCLNEKTLTESNERISITFYECVDGDTAKFKLNNKIIKVRFLAIDTKETKHPHKKEQPYGKEASKFTCNKLKKADKIEIEFDSNSNKFDKYDRHLGWIFVDNNLLQQLIIKEGLAEVAYLYDDYKYTDILLNDEKIAQDHKLGIWSGEDPKQDIWQKISDFITKIFD